MSNQGSGELTHKQGALLQSQCAVCGELKFTWQLRHMSFYDVWVCKKHPDSEVEKKLKRKKDEKR